MARKLRLQYEGAIYHVTVRGNGRREIFRDDSDRERLLWRLSESADLYEVRIYLFCLMDNHFHLVIETPRANISRFMQSVLTGYSVYYNFKHNTCGHVLQGRYGAEVVEGNGYLLSLSRYVHLNPVRIKSRKNMSLKDKAIYLRTYRWSSYRGYINKKRRLDFVEYEPTLSLMHGSRHERPQAYRRFVETGLAETDDEIAELMKSGRRGIGSKAFQKWVDKEYEELKKAYARGEDVSFRKEADLYDLDHILQTVATSFGFEMTDLKKTQYNSLARPVAARMLCKHAGMNQREAADELGYGTGASVSYQLKRLNAVLQEDKKLNRKVDLIERKIVKSVNI
jgi:REP element-mobilizing transposase RayT